MAVRMLIGNAATQPQLFQHFRSSVNPTIGNSRLQFFTASASFSSSHSPRKLVLYSKPGCCLCDGLKEKLDAAFSLSGPNFIVDIEFQVLVLVYCVCCYIHVLECIWELQSSDDENESSD
ncbi:hypothetical protein ACS0TY_011429 [Phlomoides rotata]